jgi:NADH dehydrogenase [ubiquinone] 1 alpha subcomplex assembly factor 7
MSGLGERIDLEIRTGGPMSVARYMALCLSHPRTGYYRDGDPLGAGGDFITAPEISQMFGEMIGLFLATLWQQMGSPGRIIVLELGPGRGTLMADALRAAGSVPGFLQATQLRLVDSSATLRSEQAARLASYKPEWIDDIAADPGAPLLVVANEFFDALPIRQFVRAGDGWHEREVGLAEGRRIFGLSPTPVPETSLPEPLRHAEPGAVHEIGLAGRQAMATLSAHVARRGGAILAIDYGFEGPAIGETLQAVRRHAFADPLEAPGEVDISAHVDFGALREVALAEGLAVPALATQGAFLARLGIAARAERLIASNPAAAEAIAAALDRLVAPDEMGTLFKAFCALSPGLYPPGFEP